MNIEEFINREIEAIKNIPIYDSIIENIVKSISRRIKERNGRVITSGVGKAGQIAQTLATTLSSTGTPAVFLHPLEAQHGDIGIIKSAGDVIIVISNSGETKEIIELIHLCKNMYEEEPLIISIIGSPNSSISRACFYNLYTGKPTEICPFGLTPTTSTTVMGVICDILVIKLMKYIHFTKEEYHKRHHGGYLGERSK